MTMVFLVMATASGFRADEKKPLPLKVFNDRFRAEEWVNALIDYHISPPEQPTGADSEDAWTDWRVQMKAWGAGHPAGVVAADYQHFGVYEVPLGQQENIMSISDTHFDYDQYVTARRSLAELIQEDFAEAIAHVRRCDNLILASTENLGSLEALSAAVHAHSLYLAACDLARSGHFSAMFPLMRTAMESAVYGYLFNTEEGLIEKWRNRHVSTECFNESKQAFTRAMTRFRTSIQNHDQHSGDSPYTELLMSLYDAAIDYGAHPNPIALTNNTSLIMEDNQIQFRYDYLRTDQVGICQGFFACFDYGMAIAVINHFSRMVVDPTLPGLDATFHQFYRETNVVSDKLHGEPIGFEHRYYNRINPFVSASE